MSSVKDIIMSNRRREIASQIKEMEEGLTNTGWELTYGTIGKRTTYLLLTRGEEEVVGYTFVRDLSSHDEDLGKLKALQQAVARKELTVERSHGQ